MFIEPKEKNSITLPTPLKNFSNEKIIYERENQLDTFKVKIKPIFGKSLKEEEFTDIIKLEKANVLDSYNEKYHIYSILGFNDFLFQFFES